jgi:hypothetical protein
LSPCPIQILPPTLSCSSLDETKKLAKERRREKNIPAAMANPILFFPSLLLLKVKKG